MLVSMSEGIRAEASRARRQQILDAGLDCFLERGLGATTVDRIRERCGASVGSFYHHFTSKVEVAAALYLETLESYQRALVDVLHTHKQAQSGVEGAVRHHLRWVGRQPKLASYLTHCREPEVAAASEARAQELNRAFFGEALGWLQRHAEEGHIRSLPPNLYYAIWMGPAEVFTRLWLGGGQNRARLAEAEAILAPAAWAALRAAVRSQRGRARSPTRWSAVTKI
jgi:AcrR family transcriptional regulator